MKNNMKTNVNDRCYCPQCDSSYDYKEMADENICQECVSHLREVQKVELRKLLNDMPEDDIDEVTNGIDMEILRDDIIDEIDDWMWDNITSDIGKEDFERLADRIIKLI